MDRSANQTSKSAVDIYEDEHNITLKLEVPGIDEKDIDVRIENTTLTVHGERKIEKEEKEENFRRVERALRRVHPVVHVAQLPVDLGQVRQAEITVEGADHPHKHIRIENTLTDENGEEVGLKQGAKVQVTVRSGAVGTRCRK